MYRQVKTTCIDKLAAAAMDPNFIVRFLDPNFIAHFLDLILKVLEYVHIVWYNKDTNKKGMIKMRQVTVKEIRELTEVETELLLTNATVRQEIISWANECETYYFDEIFYCISSSLSEWSIDMPFNSFIKVKNYQDFYSGIKDMYEQYGVFHDTDIIERLDKIFDMYYTTADGGEFVKHMKALESDIAIVLGSYATYYYSFTVLELESDYVMVWLESNYNMECIVDGDSVTLLNY